MSHWRYCSTRHTHPQPGPAHGYQSLVWDLMCLQRCNEQHSTRKKACARSMALGSQRKGVCTGWGKQCAGECDATSSLPKLRKFYMWLEIASMQSVRIQVHTPATTITAPSRLVSKQQSASTTALLGQPTLPAGGRNCHLQCLYHTPASTHCVCCVCVCVCVCN